MSNEKQHTPERFNRAIAALVKAFFDGMLRKGDCTACAVGNICEGRSEWSNVFMTTSSGRQVLWTEEYTGIAKELINKTGYHWTELSRLEKAFEHNTRISGHDYLFTNQSAIMEYQYNGLMAVVSVLCEIEGIKEVEKVKEMFSYQH